MKQKDKSAAEPEDRLAALETSLATLAQQIEQNATLNEEARLLREENALLREENAARHDNSIIKGLEGRIAQLGQMLGVPAAESVPESEKASDYIALGSPGHAVFLGLVIVEKDTDTTGYTTYTSKDTNTEYHLVDEFQAVQNYPGLDPEKAILLHLRSKVSSLESGPPSPPVDAPSLMLMDRNDWT